MADLSLRPDAYLAAQMDIGRVVCHENQLPTESFSAQTLELTLPPMRIWFGFVDAELPEQSLKAQALCATVHIELPCPDGVTLPTLQRFVSLADRLVKRAAATTSSPCFWRTEPGRPDLSHPAELRYEFGVMSAGHGVPLSLDEAPQMASGLVRSLLGVLHEHGFHSPSSAQLLQTAKLPSDSFR